MDTWGCYYYHLAKQSEDIDQELERVQFLDYEESSARNTLNSRSVLWNTDWLEDSPPYMLEIHKTMMANLRDEIQHLVHCWLKDISLELQDLNDRGYLRLLN